LSSNSCSLAKELCQQFFFLNADQLIRSNVEMSKIWKCQKWLKMSKNDWKCQKITENVKTITDNVKNDWKCQPIQHSFILLTPPAGTRRWPT
jgi:hypothetical protein